MASVADLKREIRRLQGQLDELNRKNEQIRQQLEGQSARRIRELEDQYRQLLKQKEQENEAAYALKLQQLEEQLLREHQAGLERLRKEEERARKEREKAFSQLQKDYEELSRMALGLQEKEQAQEEISKKTALEIAGEAETAERRIDEGPHEFFFPGQMDVIRDHMEKASRFLERGLYGPAAAMADAALAEMELLEIRTEQEQKEWARLYERYRAAALRLGGAADRFEGERIRTGAGEFVLGEREREYWSSGMYAKVAGAVREACAMVDEVDRIGIPAYLKGGNALQKGRFLEAARAVAKLEDQLTAVITCIRNERIFSDERFVLGNAIADVYEEEGYAIRKGCFRKGLTREEEPMECFDVEASLNGTDVVQISFVPCRQDGVAVRNDCIIDLKITTLPEKGVVDEMVRVCKRRLAGIRPGLTAVSFVGEQPAREQREQALKQQPDPGQLARRLERKYQ